MALFKKTNTKLFAKPSQKVTPDTVYWKKFGTPVILKEFGPIDYIDFSPVEPYYFAVTSSVKVQIYNPFTKAVYKTLSKFKENAYGGKFRSDGQLLCAGGEECLVKLFDVHSKSLLRVFKGHSSSVRRCFFTSDQTHIVSFSDDKTSILWDLPSESAVETFYGHNDYVRGGCVSPVSPDIFISGSYDGKLCMFDSRTSNKPVFTVDHGSPVESVIFLPSGGIFVSAGGLEVRVWDSLAGGRPLARLCGHHKTVTTLCLASLGSRLASGSLDKHIKLYDVSTYKLVHTIDQPNPIFSLAISANDDTLAAGSVDGTVAVSKREIQVAEQPKKKKLIYRNMGDKFVVPTNVDSVVPLEGRQVESKYDTCLRKFQYSKALDSVLIPYFVNQNPHVTVSVMQELIRRKGLENALSQKQGKQLIALLRFLIRYIGDYRFTNTLIDVTNSLIDTQESKMDEAGPAVIELFKRLQQRLHEEENLTRELTLLSGQMEMLLAASSINDYANVNAAVPSMTPSVAAQQNLILNV